MRAGPSQEEIRRQNLGALLRLVHVRGALSRAELTTRTGPQPIHDRRADHGSGRRRPGARGATERPRPGRTTVAGGPARVDSGLRVRVRDRRRPAHRGPRRARRQGPRPAGNRTRPGRRVAGRGGRAAGRVRPADAAGHSRRTRSASAAASRSARWSAGRTASYASDRTSAGSTSRSAPRSTASSPRRSSHRHRQRRRPRRAGGAHPRRGGRLRQPDLPARRRRHRRRHHRRRTAGRRPRRLRRRGRPHRRQPERPAVQLRLARLLGDRDRRACAAAGGRSERHRARGHPDRRRRGVRVATRSPRPPSGRSATGSASASPTWSTSSTRRRCCSAARCATIYLAAAAQVRSRVNRNALPACREHLRLRTPELGDDAPLIGAAELAFGRILADPLAGAEPPDAGGAGRRSAMPPTERRRAGHGGQLRRRAGGGYRLVGGVRRCGGPCA